jgi:hypothetical protein
VPVRHRIHNATVFYSEEICELHIVTEHFPLPNYVTNLT